MSWIGPFVVAPLWAFGSAQLFVQGWLAAADLVIAVIALLRGRMAGRRAAGAIVASLVTGVVCSVVLRVGYWVVRDALGYGHSWLERILYWSLVVPSVGYHARQAPAKVRTSWQAAMTRPLDAPSS